MQQSASADANTRKKRKNQPIISAGRCIGLSLVHTFSAQHSLKKFLHKKFRIVGKTVKGKDADLYPGKGELVYITRSILDESVKIVSVPFKQISLSVLIR